MTEPKEIARLRAKQTAAYNAGNWHVVHSTARRIVETWALIHAREEAKAKRVNVARGAS